MSDMPIDSDTPVAQGPKKRRLLPILLGVVGAILMGAATFYAVISDMVRLPAQFSFDAAKPGTAIAYVPIDVITVSLPPNSGARRVRLGGQVEVARSSHAAMMQLQPRFTNTVMTYLHAVSVDDLREPAALLRLRAQLLRRLQIVAGEDHVRDFLITDFLLD